MSTINVNNVMPVTGDTVNINGVTMINGVLSATTYVNIPTTSFTGGTVDGFAEFNNGLSSTTVSATTFYGDGSQLTGISGGTGAGIIEVTKAELDVLISTSGLTAGSTYKITGVDVDLYSGTTIFLQALASNELKTNGTGVFYNPKYTIDSIWTNFISFYMQNRVGEFETDEMVVSDTNAYGYIKTYGMVEWLSGDWTSATTLTGVSSFATADISDINFSNYGLNDTVIWGGKKWVNVSGNSISVVNEVLGYGDGIEAEYNFTVENRPVTPQTFTLTDGVETFTSDINGVLESNLSGVGQIDYKTGYFWVNFQNGVISGSAISVSYDSVGIGHSIGEYQLNDIWMEIPFNDTDYDVVFDEIDYNIGRDMITSRKDRFNNIVNCSYQSILELKYSYDLGNPIKDFQWGNGVDNWGYDSGLYNFSDLIDNNNGISDGGDDMYDGGNEIYTDLGNVPYTHTRLTIELDGGIPSYLFPKDGSVVSGDTYFGLGSEYFTNLYPGLFVLHANAMLVNEFMIDGNIGADGDGQYEVDEYVLTGFTTNYKVFVKKVYNAGDPSINHIMIVDTDDSNIIHEYDTSTQDDFDKISSLSAATKVHYLLTSTFPGNGYITKAKIDEIVTTYLTLVDGRPTISDVLTALNDNYETITNLLPVAQSTNYSGVMGNYVNDSYLGCLNFNGGYIWNNNLTQHSYISNNYFTKNTYDSDGYIVDNDLTGGSYIVGNYISNSSSIVNNNLNHFSSIRNNRMDSTCDIESNEIIFNSSLSYNVFYGNFDIRKNKIIYNSYFDSNRMISGNFTFNTLDSQSNFSDNIGNSFNVENNTLNQNSILTGNHAIGCSINNNNLISGSQINYNNFSGCTVITNTLSNSYINFNTVDAINFGSNASIANNVMTSTSYINDNVLSGGGNSISSNVLGSETAINYNKLGVNSSILFNSLTNYSKILTNNLTNQGYISYNSLDSGSVITDGTFDLNARVENCKLSNTSTFYLFDTPIITQTIRYIDANRGVLNGDLTSATNIYSIASKTLMNNASDVPALIFIDGSNVQQIVATNS